jgi:hypothetical protein
VLSLEKLVSRSVSQAQWAVDGKCTVHSGCFNSSCEAERNGTVLHEVAEPFTFVSFFHLELY